MSGYICSGIRPLISPAYSRNSPSINQGFKLITLQFGLEFDMDRVVAEHQVKNLDADDHTQENGIGKIRHRNYDVNIAADKQADVLFFGDPDVK